MKNTKSRFTASGLQSVLQSSVDSGRDVVSAGTNVPRLRALEHDCEFFLKTVETTETSLHLDPSVGKFSSSLPDSDVSTTIEQKASSRSLRSDLSNSLDNRVISNSKTK
jgi:hypothetical protein